MRYLPVILLVLFGCKNVQYNFNGADIPVDAKTYSVELFEVRAPLANPIAGQTLTETVRDLLQAQTPLRYLPFEGDLQYTGSITGYDVQPVAIQGNETAALNRLTVKLKVDYINTVDEKKNKEFTVTRFADYDSSQDLSAVESELLQTISDQLAQDVFDRTLGDW